MPPVHLFAVHFDFGGYALDALDVDGDLAYAGALTLDLVNGFTPTSGDAFQLFNVTGGHTGAFDSISFADAGWAGSFDYATGTLAISAVPEPSTYAILAGLAVLGFAWWRARRDAS